MKKLHKIVVPNKSPVVLYKQKSDVVFHLDVINTQKDHLIDNFSSTNLIRPNIAPRRPPTPEKSHKIVPPHTPPAKSVTIAIPKPPSTSKALSPTTKTQPIPLSATQAPRDDENDITKFVGPMKSNLFFARYKKYLTKAEKSEIHRYPQIYYLRKCEPPKEEKPKKKDKDANKQKQDHDKEKKAKDDKEKSKFFPFTIDEHIGYRYQQVAVLGQGSFGSVIKCVDHKTGQFVAIKMLKFSKKANKELKLEMEILKHLQLEGENHHIIKYIDFFLFRGFFCIVMELLSESLSSYIKHSPSKKLTSHEQIFSITKQMCCALLFMHNSGVIHCDIKPDNILFTNQRKTSIRLIDFGCSCYEGKTIYSYIQTRYYRAPEVVLNLDYDSKIDIWSLGCVLYEMCTGKVLFPGEDEEEVFHMMLEKLGMPSPEFMLKAKKKCTYIVDATSVKPYRNPHTMKSYKPGADLVKDELEFMGKEFVDVVLACLTIDASERKPMREIINLDFFK